MPSSVFLLAAVGVSTSSAAAQVRVSISGGVYTAADQRPLNAALVSIDGGVRAARSDIHGQFELTLVEPGEHYITFERAGFNVRAFHIDIADTLAGVLDIGPVELTRSNAPSVRVMGTASDLGTSNPVTRAAIGVNGEVVALTDDAGRFVIDSVEQGNNLLTAHRIGYAPFAADLYIAEGANILTVTIPLEPLPFRLDDVEVVVDGDRTLYARGRMRGFYQRKRTTPGTFFTRDDIERRNPMFLSDMLRTVPGIRVTHSGFDRNITVRGCTPVVYLDGMPLRAVQLDDLVWPGDVEAIEIHRGAFLPVEFMTFGACAAIAIWTR